MTNTSTQAKFGPQTLVASLAYFDEIATPDLPDLLTLELTADEVAAVHEARRFQNRNPTVHSVNVRCTPPEIEDWRYDVSYVTVFRDVGCYLFLQGKYDCSEQVEYSLDI
jgi:hypothetical protein